jgi:molecular chaperone GrpE (heat shock protein)
MELGKFFHSAFNIYHQHYPEAEYSPEVPQEQREQAKASAQKLVVNLSNIIDNLEKTVNALVPSASKVFNQILQEKGENKELRDTSDRIKEIQKQIASLADNFASLTIEVNRL